METGYVFNLGNTYPVPVFSYFYHLAATGDTPAEWTVQNDNHLFRPFWAPLDNLPEIVEPQDGWVRYVLEGEGYLLEIE